MTKVRPANLGRGQTDVLAAPLRYLLGMLSSVPGSLLLNTPALNLDRELHIQPENRLLDIGCGHASLLKLLSSRVGFRRPPLGLDISRQALASGQREANALELLQANATQLPLADDSFDVVTASYLTLHLAEDGLLQMLGEIRRVLAPAGIALVWDFAPTRSEKLNTWNRHFLRHSAGGNWLRSYSTLSAYALEAGFDWVANAHLRPFLFPPIPRASVILGKAPLDWPSQRGTHPSPG